MPKTKISEYSATNSSNTDIEGINIDEGCAPSGINNAIRELMVHLKEFQTGASGDAFTFAGGTLMSGTNTISGAAIISGNINSSGTNTFSGSNVMSFSGGSSASPSIYFASDTNTGIFSPAADTIAFSEGGVESMRIDSDGDVGIGTTSPSQRLEVSGGDAKLTAAANGTRNLFFGTSGTNYQTIKYDDVTGALIIGSISSAYPVVFQTQGVERARITSGGDLLVGTTSAPESYTTKIAVKANIAGAGVYSFNQSAGADSCFNGKVSSTSCYLAFWNYNSTNVGTISTNGTTTSYNTTSDYRLKENIAPMTGALAKVAALKPCTYTWKTNGSAGEGFIAHELQAIVPNAVHGEKDAVKDDGTFLYQGIDTSFLVATLTAAIQELKAELDATKAEVAALKAGNGN